MCSKLRKRSDVSLFQLKPYLDEINDKVEQLSYINNDPVQFMHAYSDKKDQEIAGFLAATMAWGRRDIVVSKTANLLSRMNYQPYQFVTEYNSSHFTVWNGFKHRTFKPIDIHGIISGLKEIYAQFRDMESFWTYCCIIGKKENRSCLAIFREQFFRMTNELENRTKKHISSPESGSTCKRICMFLRWSVRKESPVDAGIWSSLNASSLHIPFDVHVARQSRRYGLLTRKSNDWKSVLELTNTLKRLNPEDPSKYDYALFGIGALDYSLPKKFILNKV